MSRTTEARKYLSYLNAQVVARKKKITHAESVLGKYPELISGFLAQPNLQELPPITVGLLTNKRDELAEYASIPVRHHGNEYYSCCGREDMEGEMQDFANEQARLLTTCIRVLKWDTAERHDR